MLDDDRISSISVGGPIPSITACGGHDVSLPGQLGGWSVMLRHGLRKIDYFTISSAV